MNAPSVPSGSKEQSGSSVSSLEKRLSEIEQKAKKALTKQGGDAPCQTTTTEKTEQSRVSNGEPTGSIPSASPATQLPQGEKSPTGAVTRDDWNRRAVLSSSAAMPSTQAGLSPEAETILALVKAVRIQNEALLEAQKALCYFPSLGGRFEADGIEAAIRDVTSIIESETPHLQGRGNVKEPEIQP